MKIRKISKLARVLVIILVAPLLFGGTLFVVEYPEDTVEMRIGQQLEYWGHVLNDSNEPMPFDFGVTIEGPNNATWDFEVSTPRQVNWKVNWIPTVEQVGTNEFTVIATDVEQTIQNIKTKTVVVHPRKLPPPITQDGCNVF